MTAATKPAAMSWTAWARSQGLHPTTAAMRGIIPMDAVSDAYWPARAEGEGQTTAVEPDQPDADRETAERLARLAAEAAGVAPARILAGKQDSPTSQARRVWIALVRIRTNWTYPKVQRVCNVSDDLIRRSVRAAEDDPAVSRMLDEALGMEAEGSDV